MSAIEAITAAPACDVCTQPVLAYGRRRHFVCDPETHIGKQCTCPPGCTDELVGDGPAHPKFGQACDPECVPCRVFAGTVHADNPEWKDRKQ